MTSRPDIRFQTSPHPAGIPVRSGQQRGFTVIEVVISMLLLSIILASSAVAVSSSERAGTRVEVKTSQHSIAQKALERLNSDQQVRTFCNNQWRSQTPNYQPCTPPDVTIRDEQGRSYTVQRTIRALDDEADGTGENASLDDPTGDADNDRRDFYDATIRVTLNADSTANVETNQPSTIHGRVNWYDLKDNSVVVVRACVTNRPDRSVTPAECDGSGQSGGGTPLAGVRVQLQATSDSGNTAVTSSVGTTSGGTGAVTFDGSSSIVPGRYRVRVLPPYPGGAKPFKVNPELLTVGGSDRHDVSITMNYDPGLTRVCARIGNDDEYDFGYEITKTHVMWNLYASPVYMGTPITSINVNQPNFWNCNWRIVDPLQYENSNDCPEAGGSKVSCLLFRGNYALEVEEVPGALRVTRASYDCQGADTTIPEVGSINPTSHVVGAPSWKGYWNRTDSGDHTICFEFWVDPIDAVDCTPGSPGCQYLGQECQAYCPSGQDVCVANCDGEVSEEPDYNTLASPRQSEEAWVTGGPNDPTVPCTTINAGGPPYYPNNNYWDARMPYGDTRLRSVWGGFDWVGGGPGYRALGYNGTHPWAPSGKFECDEVAFSRGTPLAAEYPLGTCVRVTIKGGYGSPVHGRVVDVSGSTARFFPTISAARSLRVGSSPPASLMNHYNAYGFPDGLPNSVKTNGWPDLIVQKINEVGPDDVCNWGRAANEPVIEWRDPVYEDIYKKPVDDPAKDDPATGPSDVGNVVGGDTGVSSDGSTNSAFGGRSL